jgi:hypothetical protein
MWSFDISGQAEIRRFARSTAERDYRASNAKTRRACSRRNRMRAPGSTFRPNEATAPGLDGSVELPAAGLLLHHHVKMLMHAVLLDEPDPRFRKIRGSSRAS